MAPGYLTTGLGFTYDPGKIFTVVLSPASWRGTFVLNDRLSDEGAYGVDPGKHLLSAFGANLKGEVKYEFLKNMTVYSRLDLYSDYLHKPTHRKEYSEAYTPHSVFLLYPDSHHLLCT